MLWICLICEILEQGGAPCDLPASPLDLAYYLCRHDHERPRWIATGGFEEDTFLIYSNGHQEPIEKEQRSESNKWRP